MALNISVIIPVYNNAGWIGETLASVFAQTTSPFEVIVVDDGSTDDLDSALLRWRERIQLIRIPNSGVNVARNTGAQAASGNWLAFLDSDDIWMPDFLESHVRLIELAGNVRVAFTDYALLQDNHLAEKSRFNYLPPSFWNVQRRDFGQFGFVLDESIAGQLPLAQPALPSASIFSFELFRELEGWDLRMNRSKGGQDVEFLFRALDRFPVGVVPVVLVGYRRHSTSWTADQVSSVLADIDLWRRIAIEFELGRRYADVIEKATEELMADLLVTAFHKRRFDICRQIKGRVPGSRLPLPMKMRIALTELPDPILNAVVRLGSKLRGQ
jgi:glycosyltransferase involved in cell wall biosynthesis